MSYLPDQHKNFSYLFEPQLLEPQLLEQQLLDLLQTQTSPDLETEGVLELPELPLTQTENTEVYLYFLKQLEIQADVEIPIVFIESILFLDNSVGFAQYVFKKSCLFTLISEFHNLDFKITKANELSISDYCVLAVKKNQNCRVMLELGTEYDEDPSTIHSSAIQSVYAELKKIKKENQIIYFDKRSYFLSRSIQNIIYNSGWDLKWLDKERFSQKDVKTICDKRNHIFTHYLEPFKTKTIILEQKNYDLHAWKFLLDIYSELNTFYETIKKKLFCLIIANIKLKIPEPPEIKVDLMLFWAFVTDYHIFAHILSNEFKDINEYIIIAGNKHISNLCYFFEKHKELVYELNKQFGPTINLHKTVTY